MRIHLNSYLDQVAAIVTDADAPWKPIRVALAMMHLSKGNVVQLAAIGTEDLAADTTVMLAS